MVKKKKYNYVKYILLLFFILYLTNHKKRVVVVMISDYLPTNPDDYVTLTSSMNLRWANSNGYGFEFIYRNTTCFHPKWGKRLKFWCRQLDFLQILENDWDWLLYVDADAFINPGVDFDTILKKATGVIKSPMKMWFNGSFIRQVDDPHVILSKDVDGWPGTCFGVQLWRNSPISKQIMCELFNSGMNETRTIYPNGKIEIRKNIQQKLFAEQGVMNQLLYEGKWKNEIAILPAQDLYLGGFVFHATQGAIYNGKRCHLRAKLQNCIKPAFDGKFVKINVKTPVNYDPFICK